MVSVAPKSNALITNSILDNILDKDRRPVNQNGTMAVRRRRRNPITTLGSPLLLSDIQHDHRTMKSPPTVETSVAARCQRTAGRDSGYPAAGRLRSVTSTRGRHVSNSGVQGFPDQRELI